VVKVERTIKTIIRIKVGRLVVKTISSVIALSFKLKIGLVLYLFSLGA
jgi:hypothetical protein